MRTVIVTAENNKFRARLDEQESYGQTIGQAIDALNEKFENFDNKTLYILQKFQPDEFFNAEQQKQMSELMDKLRLAQEGKGEFSLEEKVELENLVAAELEGSGNRVKKLAELMDE